MSPAVSPDSTPRASCSARHFEHFDHDADIGIRGLGPTRETAFEQAALALTAVITDPRLVSDRVRVDVTCEAADDELLLVDWLNAIVYEMAVGRLLFGRFRVEIENGRLRGSAWGEALDSRRHQPAVEIKGATCTALEVARLDDGSWVAQTVVDV
ncbi:MAG: archease [Proteobacteria bacterium]|nr:MAG: archease [Pseudomonadota bacterium]